jgi:predicted DNA-binding transcriptional regulator AlpA
MGVKMLEQLLDINDVSKLTKLSVATIRKYVLLHQIPFLKIFKAVRFRSSEIEVWINQRNNRHGGTVAVTPLEGGDLFSAAEVGALPNGDVSPEPADRIIPTEGGGNGKL